MVAELDSTVHCSRSVDSNFGFCHPVCATRSHPFPVGFGSAVSAAKSIPVISNADLPYRANNYGHCDLVYLDWQPAFVSLANKFWVCRECWNASARFGACNCVGSNSRSILHAIESGDNAERRCFGVPSPSTEHSAGKFVLFHIDELWAEFGHPLAYLADRFIYVGSLAPFYGSAKFVALANFDQVGS